MKRLILSTLFLPLAVSAGRSGAQSSTINLVEVRSGEWPMNMERTITKRDTSYSLIFRDQEVLTSEVLDTLPFPNLEQLKYFGKALTALKSGTSGDIAKFKDYNIRRADKKFDGTWYVLHLKWSSTAFRQTEADIMRNTISGL